MTDATLAEELAGLPGDVVLDVVPDEAPRVLAVHPDVSVLREIRESFADRQVGVDTSPTPDRAFEVALQRDYKLFIFALDIPRVPGDVLYHMIETAYRYAAKKGRYAPGIIFVTPPGGSPHADDLAREARVKGVLSEPLDAKRIVAAAAESLGI